MDKNLFPLTEEELKLVRGCYDKFATIYPHYEKINMYYYGLTDSLRDFKPIVGRSNLKLKINFQRKLVDEEAEYSFANPITYTYNGKSDEESKDAVENLTYIMANTRSGYDLNLGKKLINFGVMYEICYLDRDLEFRCKKVSPLNGFMYFENDIPKYFLHIYRKAFTEDDYIDVYTDNFIYHLDGTFKEISPATKHFWGRVPVGVGLIGDEMFSMDNGYPEGDTTIYSMIKTLQDAFETNFSDTVCEISDTRNAILKFFGIDLEEEVDENGNIKLDSKGNPIRKAPIMKGNNILYFADKTKENAEWLVKNINDTFVKNARDDLKDLIYTLTSHIDSNEKMQSNLSGTALRSRLQTLESRCGGNEKAMTDIQRTRIYCICKYLSMYKNKNFDYKKFVIKYTPKVPVDETTLADMISKLSHDVVSNETKRSWLPKISNVAAEQEKIDRENEKMQQMELNKFDDLNQFEHEPTNDSASQKDIKNNVKESNIDE